jgi:hypothetical protein
MQDPPSSSELAKAVSEFLRNEAMPQLTGRTAYLARVAANVMDILCRELDQAPANDQRERSRLQALLATDNTDLLQLNQLLCDRIASGQAGLQTPGLIEHLWQLTIDKVGVDQPGYSGYKRSLNEPPPTAQAKGG